MISRKNKKRENTEKKLFIELFNYCPTVFVNMQTKMRPHCYCSCEKKYSWPIFGYV